MTISYDSLSKEDKNIVDRIAEWVEEYSEAEVLGNRELLKKKLGDSNYISKNDIYEDYLSVKDDIEERCTDELFFALMEKLTGSRFDGFVDKYKKGANNQIVYQRNIEWFDMELLLDMDLEASGGVSIDNIASFMCIDKEFDEKVVRLSKVRFKAMGKVFKKKFVIDESRRDRKMLQVDKGHIFKDRYDSYLFMYHVPKLAAEALIWGIESQMELEEFIEEQREILREIFSYKGPIGNERFNRILQKLKREIARVYKALEKEDILRSRKSERVLNLEEKCTILSNVMKVQTERYNNSNNILSDIDANFMKKAVHFKTLEEEHLRYHSQR